MDYLQLVTVRGAIKNCDENLTRRKFKMTFSNNQEFEFKTTRQTFLSSLGFTGNTNVSCDDKKIKTVYNNLSSFKRRNMIKTAEAINEVFAEQNWEKLNSFPMLMYENFENKLELVVSPEGCDTYILFEINPFAKKVDSMRTVDDILSNLSGKRIVIPISVTCVLDDKIITSEKLSKNQILEAREAAISLSSYYSATFNNKLIKPRFNPTMQKKQKKNNKKKK